MHTCSVSELRDSKRTDTNVAKLFHSTLVVIGVYFRVEKKAADGFGEKV